MDAVILAGGKGTRLREELGSKPKPLVDIGGKPLLEHQLELLNRYGFQRAVVLVNHAADQIDEFLRSKSDWGMRLECVNDGEPKGTAGAVLAALDDLPDEFLVMYGDTMLNVDLRRFYSVHEAAPNAIATLLLHPNDHPADSDLVELAADGSILAFHPYPHDPARYHQNLVNAALYWVRRDPLREYQGLATPLDFGKDLFPEALKRGAQLQGYNSPEYIKDAGTPARLKRVREDLASGRIDRSSLGVKQAMVFIDRDGTINHEVDHLSSEDLLELYPGVERAIRRLNESDYRCCVVTNQPVLARGECDAVALQQIHNKLESLLGNEGAYLDRIYYCPHHPDSGFPGERVDLKISCTCRKPGTGMIESACKEFNVEVDHSWLIGDSTTDLETAARAGIRSILVETGYGGLDNKYWAEPNFVVRTLEEAVDFVLDKYPALRELTDDLAKDIQPRTVVLIGGHSRSGKSTIANVLRDSVFASGRRAVVLSLDRWLISLNRRTLGVRGRYDLDAAQSALSSIENLCSDHLTLNLPGYNKTSRQQVAGVSSVNVTPDDVVIVEGTLALDLVPPDSWRGYRLFVQVDESVRKERVVREYARRGADQDAAEAIYNGRLQDEFSVVEQTASRAQVMNLMGIRS